MCLWQCIPMSTFHDFPNGGSQWHFHNSNVRHGRSNTFSRRHVVLVPQHARRQTCFYPALLSTHPGSNQPIVDCKSRHPQLPSLCQKATWSCPHQTCQAAICIGLYSCRGLRCLGFPPSDCIVKLPATNSCSTTHTQDRLCCVPLHVFVPSNLSKRLLSESLTLSDPAPSSSSSSTLIRRTPSNSLSYINQTLVSF